jgi:hypothetical protein
MAGYQTPSMAGFRHSFRAAARSPRWGALLLRVLRVDDANELSALRTLLLKLNMPVFFCEQCVIPADANIDARMKTRAALANNDIARNNFLAAVNFHAQAFTFRIATVLGTTACFLMCHCTVPICFITQDQPELR